MKNELIKKIVIPFIRISISLFSCSNDNVDLSSDFVKTTSNVIKNIVANNVNTKVNYFFNDKSYVDFFNALKHYLSLNSIKGNDILGYKIETQQKYGDIVFLSIQNLAIKKYILSKKLSKITSY